MTSRTDIDVSWAGDLGDEGDQPRQRHSGMEREVETFDPSKVLAEIGPRGAMADMPAQVASFDGLSERPSFHEAATPPVVAQAWQALLEAIDAAVDAERAARSLIAEQAQAQRTEAAAVRASVASGKSVKLSTTPGRAWGDEQRHLEAVAGGHRDRARRVRAQYDEVCLQHQPTWAARIVEGLPSAKEQAIAALTEAGDRVERLLADASAAQTMQLEPGGSVVSLPTLQIRRFVEAAQTLAGEIEASPQLAGEGLCHVAMTPTWAERQQIAASLLAGVVDSGAYWLAELERREQFKRSSFTRGIPLPKPSEVTEW